MYASYFVFICVMLLQAINSCAAVPEKEVKESVAETVPAQKVTEKETKEKAPQPYTDIVPEAKCRDWLTGSMNVNGICYLNTALQLLQEICCNKEVWAYVQKARSAKRLIPLRKALLNFINHYTEPRVRWEEEEKNYVADIGQKWVDAVATELPKLNILRFGLLGGGNEYLAILYMLEALMGGSVNMNFTLKHTKNFTLPVGMFLSTTLYKYEPKDLKDTSAIDALKKELSTMPGDTWLERCLAYQAQKEKMKYRASVWPKFLLVIGYDAPSSDDPNTFMEAENTKEEIEHFYALADLHSFPLKLDLKKVGLSSESVVYTCRGFSLGLINHVAAVINRNNQLWQLLDDATVLWGEEVEKIVKEASTQGKANISYYPEEPFIADNLYLYVRET